MINRHITAEEKKHWSALGHLLTLEAIAEVTEWSGDKLAFQGGTSLHLSWNSPRFSEDLDFLLEESAAKRLSKVMGAVSHRVQERLALIDPAFKVQMKDKSRERMGDFRLTLSKPGIIGSVMLKAEFWKVKPVYLQHYKSTPKSPGVPADLGGYNLHMNVMMPAATLQAAYFDKLTAFATRPHLKWRDIFDFWWICENSRFEHPKTEEIGLRLMRNLSAYQTINDLPAPDALRVFTSRNTPEEMMALAEKDLRPFLTQSMWNRMWPDTVRTMVDYTLREVGSVADLVDAWLQAHPEASESNALEEDSHPSQKM
jgi:predicted nucleotidyltransferase component of viral defense system